MADAAFEAIRDGVVWIDGGRVTDLNAVAAALLHVDPERARGAPVMAVLRDHRMERAWHDRTPVELMARGRTLVVLPFAHGLVLQDVSEVRRARDDARSLLAVLSHELRTPVTTIRSVLEALRMDLPAPQRERFMERAEQEAGRLVRLLDDLTVDVAPPVARSVALLAVAEQAQALLAGKLVERAVTLTAEVADVHAWCDPDKLLQVLLNLIENAVVHGPQGATVRLVAMPEAERAGWLVVEVRDEGAPLDPQSIDGLFSPHARGRRATGRGTGLGLYIVRSIAERWGGRAWGRCLADGNAFGVTVPRERSAAR